MLARFAALLHSKAALALLGVLLIGGGGTTAIVSAHGTGTPSRSPHTSASANASGNTTASQKSSSAAKNTRDNDTNDANDDNGNDANDDDDAGELHGTIVSVGAGSFVLKLADGTTRTVTVSSQTVFEDDASGVGGLKAGAQVEVNGSAQANGAFAASRVEVRNADSGDDRGGEQHGGDNGSNDRNDG